MELLEAFNNSSDLDVSELRSKYYGRSNMYVAFSDSIFYKNDGRDYGAVVRPRSIIVDSVVDVVARKVTTPYLYANVMRINKKGWLDDIRQYDSYTFEKDLQKLRKLRSVDSKFANTVIDFVVKQKKTTNRFMLFWDITKRLSKNNQDTWNKILVDMGYTGFTDQTGTGVFGSRFPRSIALVERNLTYVDTLEIQATRKDPRARTSSLVDFFRNKENVTTIRKRIDKTSRSA